MSTFKYFTPYWRDSHTNYPENSKAYTSTIFYILNPTDVESTFLIQFYNQEGKQFVDMQTAFVLKPGCVLDIRILDVIKIKNPNYSANSALLSGSLKITSTTNLCVSGKMIKGITIAGETTERLTWSIPFHEIIILDTSSNKFNPTFPKPFVNNLDYFIKVRKPR
jgi:hypothetical protein